MASRKPTPLKLESMSRYEKHTLEVPYYVDRETGNIWFVDSKGQVLDRYLPLYDTGLGVPVPLARKSGGTLIKRVILGSLQYLFLPESKVSLSFSKAFLDLVGQGKVRVERVKDILSATHGDLHDGIKRLVRELGPREALELAVSFDADGDIRFNTKEHILKQLDEMSGASKTIEDAKAELEALAG